MTWMTALGLGLIGVGWALVVWGIARKASSHAKVVSVRDSLLAVKARLLTRLTKVWKRYFARSKMLAGRVWHAIQSIKEGGPEEPAHRRIYPDLASSLGTAFDPTVTRGSPTAEGNERRIEHIVTLLQAVENESQ